MNLFKRFHRTNKHTEAELRTAFHLGKIAGRREVMAERISFPALPAVDLAKEPMTQPLPKPGEPPGEFTRRWREANGLMPHPVRFQVTPPAWINDVVRMQSPVYEPPEAVTKADLEVTLKRPKEKKK